VKEDTKLKGFALVLSLAALVVTASCDPAVTIRQGSTLRRQFTGPSVAQPELTVRVGKYRRLIGEGFYSPEIRVSNISGLPITITSIAVVTEWGALANSPSRRQSFPMAVAPGATGLLETSFETPEGLQRTFRKPAELRVHFHGADGDSIARVRLFVAH